MKRGNKVFQKLLAAFLSLAMALTGVSFQGLAPVQAAEGEEGLILYYDFDLQNSYATEVPDVSGNMNVAHIKKMDGGEGGNYSIDKVNIYGREVKALNLAGGSDGSYLRLPDGILKDCESMTISMWVKLSTDNAYQRIWDIGSNQTEYIYLISDGGNPGFEGYATAITKSGWSNEKGVQKGSNIDKNRWVLTTVVMDGSNMSLYENGRQIGETVDTGIKVNELGNTTNNLVGLGQFDQPPTTGQFAEVKIYNKALTAEEVGAMYTATEADFVAADKAELELKDIDAVTADFELPSAGANGSSITWASDNAAIVIDGSTAKVTRPAQGAEDAKVKLTATIACGGAKDTKEFEAVVKAEYADGYIAQHDAFEAIQQLGDLSSVTEDIPLPSQGSLGSVLTWNTDNPAIKIENGVAKVTRPAVGEQNAAGKLYVDSSYGADGKGRQEINVTVLAYKEAITIKGVEEVNVATLVGHSPSLPNFVKVTYSDDTTGKLKTIWPDIIEPSKYAAAGSFVVEGAIVGETNKVTASVTVVNEEEVERHIVSESFDLSDISLDKIGANGSILTQNRDRSLAYLKLLDNKRMLYNFYKTFGENDKIADVQPLGGWDDPSGLLRGHSTGHYMSALALAYASTGDEEIKAKLDNMVSEMNRLQSKSKGNAADFSIKVPGDLAGSVNPSVWSTNPEEWGEGFVSAYSPDQFGLLEIGAPYGSPGSGIWAPYYTMHKLIAGFLDAYTYTGNELALTTASKLGKWVYNRLKVLPQEKLTEMWNMYIAGEYGGFNESLAQLYIYTKDADFLAAARLFDNTDFFNNLEKNVDGIRKLHANQHIPQIVGSIKMYEATVAAGKPEMKYYNVADNFWHMVVSRYAYSIGGVGVNEKFETPYQQAALISGDRNCETCAAYNMMKLTMMLNNYNPDDAEYMDYYERTLYNQILASQSPNVTNNRHNGVTYMLPIGPGSVRGFSNDYNDFSCCNGTGMENHVKYQEAAYAKTADTLYVGLYLPSTVTWDEKGVKVVQETSFPSDTTKLTVSAIEGGTAQNFNMKLRVPYWATKGFTVKVNGEVKISNPEISTYAALENVKAGDVIEISMPWALHLDKTPDNIGTTQVASVMYGPLVMAAQNSSKEWKTLVVSKNLEDSISEVTADKDGLPVFTAKGFNFAPMFAPQYATEAYHAYFKIIETNDDGSNWYEVKLTNSSPTRGEFAVSATMVKEGENLVITATPKDGYMVKYLLVNGKAVQMAADNTYTIPNVSSDIVIEGSFRKIDAPTSDPAHLEFTAEAFSDYTASWEKLDGIKSDWEPTKSNDGTGKGWGNWSQAEGSEHYVQYDWDIPVSIDKFEIFWYDDGGGTRIPASLQILYKDENGSWQEVKINEKYEDIIATDKYNTITFDEIKTFTVRLNMVVLQGAAANGIYRWKVSGPAGDTPVTADKKALAAAIADAGNLKEQDYTADSWGKFQTALTTANTVNGKQDATQEEVDQALKGLQDAMKALEKKPIVIEVNKTALVSAITDAGKLAEKDYTADSWGKFQTALTAAKSVNSNKDATQTEVNKATADLLGAIQNLVKKPVQAEVNKTALVSAITEAGKKVQKDYTAASWSKFQAALTAAKSVNGNKDATQAQVDKAAKDLQDAMKALQKVTVAPAKPGKAASVKALWTGKKNVKVTWKKASKATKYVVYRSYSKNGKYTKLGTTTKLAYTDKKAAPGKTAYYKVLTYNGKTKGSYSSISSAYLLKAPASLKVKVSKKNITVSFAKSAKASGYEIYTATKKNGKYKKAADLKSAKTVKKVFKKQKKGAHYYKVRAYKKNGSKKTYTDFGTIKSGKVK